MKSVLIVMSFFVVFLVIIMPNAWPANWILSLDGQDSYVEIPHAESLNITEAITLEGRVFLRDMPTGNAQAWISKYVGPMSWDVHSDGFFVSRDGNENDMLHFSTPKDEWAHIACVYDGKKQKVYINGDLVADRAWPGSIHRGTSPVQIGSHGNQYWPGKIDEVRIWRVARTREQIQETMEKSLTGDEPGLAGYWNFDSQSANDLSSNKNDGILKGQAIITEMALMVSVEDKIVNPGDEFSTNVSIGGWTDPLQNFSLDLKFNPLTLEAVSLKIPESLSDTSQDVLVDNENGLISNIQGRFDKPDRAIEARSILATATFKAKRARTSRVHLESLTLYGGDGRQIPTEGREAQVSVYPHGKLSGVVHNVREGKPISGVNIEVSNGWFSTREVVSDDEGKYIVPGAPVGNVNVRASKYRYHAITKKGIRVAFGEEVSNLDFQMKQMPPHELTDPFLATESPPADSFIPAWSPDGTKIAFTSNRDGDNEIYVMNADGSNQTRLTNNPAEDEHPTWFPDGSKIAFTSDRNNDLAVYTMQADGTKQIGLTNEIVSLKLAGLPPHSEVNLHFDLYLLDSWEGDSQQAGPDHFRVGFGKSLTNVFDETFNTVQSHRQGAHAGQSYRATKPEKSGEDLGFAVGWVDTIYRNLNNGFSFPHTGDTLTLSFSAIGSAPLGDESWGIDNVKVTIDGVDILDDDFEGGAAEAWSQRITNTDHADHFTEFLGRFGETRDEFLTWSPDGKRIAYSGTGRERGTNMRNREIYVANADGSNWTRLTDTRTAETWLAWSPDGRYIAFQSEQSGNDEIWIMHLDGTGQRNLTNHPAGDGGSPAWSPDARKIAFTSIRDFNLEVYVIDVDGANPTRLTEDDATDGWPSWSPDGNKIAFTSDRDGNFEIYVMDTDGSNPVRLTHTQHEGIAEDGKASK